MKKINARRTNLYDKEKKDRCKARGIRETKRGDIIKSLSKLYPLIKITIYIEFLLNFLN